jgi:periplasmic protein TonB
MSEQAKQQVPAAARTRRGAFLDRSTIVRWTGASLLAAVALMSAACEQAPWSKKKTPRFPEPLIAEVSVTPPKPPAPEPPPPPLVVKAAPRPAKRKPAAAPVEKPPTPVELQAIDDPALRVAEAAPALAAPAPAAPPPPTAEELEALAIARARIYSKDDDDVIPARLLTTREGGRLFQDVRADMNTMELIVSSDGRVESVRLLTTPKRMTDMLLLSGAKTWAFQPALKDGTPVRYRTVFSWETVK